MKSIALLGAGHWGRNHLRNLHQMGVLHSVYDSDVKTVRERSSDYPAVPFVKDEKDIYENAEVEAVVIATPAASHYEHVRRYLQSGRDVLVEKPLALRSKEGEELVELADKKGRVLMVGHILQYHPAVLKLKELIDFGELGNLRYIYSSRLNLGKMRIEENVLWSFAPHDISVMLMFMNGEKPETVSAFGGSYISQGVFDTTVTNLTFESGIRGHIYVSWLHPFKEQKLVVIGESKMAVFDDMSTEKLFLYPYKVDLDLNAVPVAHKVEYYIVKLESREPLREELEHFVTCIRTRRKPKTDGGEGLQVLEVLERAEACLAQTSR